MSKRFVITESDRDQIRKMYGLLNEQSPIKIQGKQPANNTDWDLVHGILGSKRIDDDLEYRVGEELKKGNYRVTKVSVTSKKVGNEIITDASVDLVPDNNRPHKVFTTRGSIGGDYVARHDQQVNGLSDRLKTYYKGEVTVFGPYEIPVQGTSVKYKQTFFAVEGPITQTNQQQGQGQQQSTDQTQNYTITGTDIPNLRENVKNQTYNKGLKIDIDSIRCDIKNLKITFESGETPITSMSLIFDNVSEQSLQDRIKNKIIPQNPGFTKTGWAGYNNGYWWVLGVIK
jgi:hypothetical protein